VDVALESGVRALLADGGFRRLWLIGAATGVMRWLDIVVAGIYVFDVTGSPAWVAVVTFMRMVPMIAGVLFGMLATRVALTRLMRFGLATIAATYAILAALAFLDLLAVWHVAAGALIVGAYWSSENPVRRTLICTVVGTANTGTAMSFDWATINALRLAGPFAGGALYAAWGVGAPYMLGVVCFGGAMVLALGLPATLSAAARVSPRLRDDFIESLAIVRGSPVICGVLGVSLCLNFFGFPYASMIPVIGKDVLHAAPADVGLLSSVEGLGAMLGAVILTALVRPVWFGRAFLAGSFAVALGAIGFGLSGSYILSVLTLILAGAGMSWFAAMQSTQVLAHTPADRRPDLMGVLTTTIGLGQTGTLHMGWLASQLGAPAAVAVSAACAVAALVFCAWRWPALWRPGYREAAADAAPDTPAAAHVARRA
jgi:predicted MFS family arabinose efflux permease